MSDAAERVQLKSAEPPQLSDDASRRLTKFFRTLLKIDARIRAEAAVRPPADERGER